MLIKMFLSGKVILQLICNNIGDDNVMDDENDDDDDTSSDSLWSPAKQGSC